MKVVLASNNQHKVEEIQQVIGDQLSLVSMKEFDIPSPPETVAVNLSADISSLTGMRFIEGDPMNVATNRLAGRS